MKVNPIIRLKNGHINLNINLNRKVTYGVVLVAGTGQMSNFLKDLKSNMNSGPNQKSTKLSGNVMCGFYFWQT